MPSPLRLSRVRPAAGRALFAACAVTATLAALGKHTPFYDLISTVVLPLRLLRYPYKAMVLAAFACALLAGMGYDAWRIRREGDRGDGASLVPLPLRRPGSPAWAVALTGLLAAPAVARWLLDPETSAAGRRPPRAARGGGAESAAAVCW